MDPIWLTSSSSPIQLSSHQLDLAVAAPASRPDARSEISPWDGPSVSFASEGSKLDEAALGPTRPARDNNLVHHAEPDRGGSTESCHTPALQWQSPGLVPPKRPLETGRSATTDGLLTEQKSTNDSHPSSCRRTFLSRGFNETYSTTSLTISARADADLGRTSRQDYSHPPSGNADTKSMHPLLLMQAHLPPARPQTPQSEQHRRLLSHPRSIFVVAQLPSPNEPLLPMSCTREPVRLEGDHFGI